MFEICSERGKAEKILDLCRDGSDVCIQQSNIKALQEVSFSLSFLCVTFSCCDKFFDAFVLKQGTIFLKHPLEGRDTNLFSYLVIRFETLSYDS